MRSYTVHLPAAARGAAPELVGEGFSIGALLFGPLWLLSHRAWIPAAFDLVLGILVAALTHGGAMAALLLALAVAQGTFGNELRRWSLAWRGRQVVHVVAAPDIDSAYGRLLLLRPDLRPAVAS